MPEPAPWQQSWRKRAEVGLIGRLGAPIIRTLGASWEWRVEGAEHLASIDAGGRHAVLACWHGRILPAIVYFRNRGVVAITSENYDGEWIARIIGRLGYGTARGSSSRGGSRGLLQLVRAVRHASVAITVDGPRGPARVAQAGAVWLSKGTGNPVVPFHLEASSHWTLGSWDAMQIPKPRSVVAMAIGAPFQVPSNATPEQLEACRIQLEHAIGVCEQRCLALLEEIR